VVVLVVLVLVVLVLVPVVVLESHKGGNKCIDFHSGFYNPSIRIIQNILG
jgi:hypothetical protein